MRFLVKLTLILLIVVLPTAACAIGPEVRYKTAVWDPNPPEENVVGYYLYWKKGVEQFANDRRAQTNATTLSLTSLALTPDIYTLAVSAFDLTGNESGMSNEIVWNSKIPMNVKNLKEVE